MGKWLNRKCILCWPSYVLLCVCTFFFFPFQNSCLSWTHILKCLLSNLVQGIPSTTHHSEQGALPHHVCQRSTEYLKVKTQSIKSLIGRPKAWFGNQRPGNRKSHCPSAFLSFCLFVPNVSWPDLPNLIEPRSTLSNSVAVKSPADFVLAATATHIGENQAQTS